MCPQKASHRLGARPSSTLRNCSVSDAATLSGAASPFLRTAIGLAPLTTSVAEPSEPKVPTSTVKWRKKSVTLAASVWPEGLIWTTGYSEGFMSTAKEVWTTARPTRAGFQML